MDIANTEPNDPLVLECARASCRIDQLPRDIGAGRRIQPGHHKVAEVAHR